MERTSGAFSSRVRVKNRQISVRGEQYVNHSRTAQRRFAVWSTHTRIWFAKRLRVVCKPSGVLVYTRLEIHEQSVYNPSCDSSKTHINSV